MSKIVRSLLFVVICSLSSITATAQWTQMGSAPPWGDTRLATAVDGTLYLASLRADTVTLYRFDGTQWQHLAQRGGFTSSFFTFGIDKKGAPYIVADAARHMFVIKYDGTSWVPVGDPSGVRGTSNVFESQIEFDSFDRPCVMLFNEGVLVRFDGTSWTQIGSKAPGIAYQAISSDEDGAIYAVNNALGVFRHIADTAWANLATSGIQSKSPRGAVLGLNPAGTLHVAFTGWSDSTSMYRYNAGAWLKLGDALPRTRNLNSTCLFGKDGAPYLLLNRRSSAGGDFDLVRFDGRKWVDVDTVGLGSADRRSPAISDRLGNIYVAVTTPGLGMFRVMKYDTRQDGLSAPVAPRVQSASAVPVPATNELLVRCTDPTLKNKTATVTDMQGRTIHRFRLSAETRLSPASWPSGVYQIVLPDAQVLKVVRQ